MHHATVIPVNAMGDAIYLDAVIYTLENGHQVEASSKSSKPILKLTQRLDADRNAGLIGLHNVLLAAQAINF